ncbi:ScbA/BarX family gamma-butyrolactone biosynthesis protein [Streptomyces amakusaensis]|uniref:ScbA/BarX family gamma-butyrolactone biosynthesis protein n=1 Tax=Streptomyces amakusaensis TaxID=67271 RepID=A0ABW0A9D4_9ACTN
MTITGQEHPADTAGPGDPVLAYDRPVERSVVHRHADAEVFVTDSAATGPGRYAVAALLPRAHACFGDHAGAAGPVDPLLLLECFRQAGTVVAHRHLGVPMDTAFLITEWGIRLTAAAALPPGDGDGDGSHGSHGDGPARLLLTIEARNLNRRAGRLLGATLVAEMYLGGELVARGTVGAGYPNKEAYAGFRTLRRSSPAPLSDAMPARGPGSPLAPGAVGRRRAENVVLADGERNAGRSRAVLDVPVAHPVFYDHPLDHVPAMALLEAARQAAIFSEGEAAGGPGHVTAVTARFQRFVEHDAPATVTAAPATARPADGDDHVVAVEFRQSDGVVCTAEVTLSGPGGKGRR